MYDILEEKGTKPSSRHLMFIEFPGNNKVSFFVSNQQCLSMEKPKMTLYLTVTSHTKRCKYNNEFEDN